MELELKKERYSCYRPGAVSVSTDEETAETIVPDYCPDIARIADACACLFVRGRSVSEGKLTVTGSVRVTLLYIAEGSQGLRSLEYTIPVEKTEKLPEGCERAAVEGRICSVDVRALNPRKLFTRLELEWRATPYCRMTMTTCGEIAERQEYSVQTLSEKHDVSLIRAVSDKDFVFSDEFSLPGGSESIADILCSRIKARITEAKSVGSKAVIKGTACISLLYASPDGKLCSYAEELPFSQILDGAAIEESENYSVSASLDLSGCEIHTTSEGGEGRGVSVKLFMNAFVVLRSTETVECIIDLYSTAYELDAKTECVELWQEPEAQHITQNVREQLETGMEVRSVLSTDVCFGSPCVVKNGAQAAVSVAATLSALYMDESGSVFSVKRRLDVTANADVGEGAQVSVEDVCAGDISANINSLGIELRFPAEFTVVSLSAPQCRCLASLTAAPLGSEGGGEPSLVLRALGESESLWDVAKQYRTTVEEILSANELTDGAVPEIGSMLLIPRKR